MPASANIARHLQLMTARQPHQAALKVPRGRTADGTIDYLTLSFAELDQETDAWGCRLQAAGVRRGDRTLVMVRPGLPLIAAVFALFKLGAVPVVIDPGMGLINFLRCVTRSRPRALVGVPLAQVISRTFIRAFAGLEVRVTASPSLTARQPRPQKCHVLRDTFPAAAGELAAILFTSGSTGAPKGVCYEHGMFEAQVSAIRGAYDIQPGEVDLPLLPVFALFNPALGMTTVVPELDPRRPAAADPAKIVQAIRQEGVTNSFGSPTLWLKIQQHCLAHHLTLPTLRRVLCAGAPVPAALWREPARWLPQGGLHSPYGATEALPVSSVSAAEINLATARGACVGRPLPGMEVRIIALTDAPLSTLADSQELPAGAIGEIIVSGPVVTKTYDGLPAATAAAKIRDRDRVWHRMGDCGFLDASGRLWFCGRKAERVTTTAGPLFTEPCEQVFRSHPQVARCALVGLGPAGQQEPALAVQTAGAVGRKNRDALAQALHTLAETRPHTRGIRRFFFRKDFPLDVRHNAKIHRLALARWAARTRGYTIGPEP